MGRMLILDGMNVIHRFTQVYPRGKSKDGIPNGGLYGFVWSLRQFLADEPHDHVVVAMDWARPAFRSEICPEYKAQRAEKRDEEQERLYQNAKAQGEILWKVMNPFGIPVVRAENWEGDDVIAALALVRYQDFDITIHSTDKDFIALASNRVALWNPLDKEYREPSATYLLERCLDPKASDNLDGVYGVGPKMAGDLLKAFDAWARERKGKRISYRSTEGLELFLKWCQEIAPTSGAKVAKGAAKVVDAQQKVRANFKCTCLHQTASQCNDELLWRMGELDRGDIDSILDRLDLLPLVGSLSSIMPLFERLDQSVF